MSDAGDYKPQIGTWTLTAPDGRTWKADSPLQCCGAESRERIPADVALQRIYAACDESEQEDAARDAALENVRLFAARHRADDWAKTVLRFCSEAGVKGSPSRSDEYPN